MTLYPSSIISACQTLAHAVRRHPYVACLLILALIFIPWLGLTPFNTKGEPREAVVALSMLKSGNWILPVSLGEDIPYKPPFLAWCIALFSLIGGTVTEFTSRLPSALAAIGLCLTTLSMLRRTGSSLTIAITTTLILATSVEVWRAASACRVDMLLTFFIVDATYLLYLYVEKGCRSLPWGAVACMSCGVLTKGPVGFILPLLVAGIYGLLRGHKFLFLLGRLSAAAALSMLLPALWYVAAYNQGGDEFLNLAFEENFGRFLGKMSYDSHVKPMWYNFATIASGLLPYTLFLIFAIPAGVRFFRAADFRATYLRSIFHSMEPWRLYSLVASVTIFVFYCIPKSKRSVYLLPVYPFAAYFITLVLLRLRDRWPSRLFARILAAMSVIIPVIIWGFTAFSSLFINLIPEKGVASVMALASSSTSLISIVCLGSCIVVGMFCWHQIRRHRIRLFPLPLLLPVIVILITFSASVLPPMLTAKSDRALAAEIERIVPGGPVYQYITAPMLRFYTANFYLGDRICLFETHLPERGWLIVGDNDIDAWRKAYGADYRANTVMIWERPGCDTSSRPMLLRFSRR